MSVLITANQVCSNRVVIVSGHFGTGKTEFSVNYVMEKAGVITGAIEIFTPNSPVVYDDNLVEHLSNLAMNDQLTGTPNRRKLSSCLEYRLLEFNTFSSSFCVIFLDLDNFGEFNNRHGHAGGDTAGLMLTNPNTLGLFDDHILEIADIVHQAGGLLYYDGANANAIVGVCRPGDMTETPEKNSVR